MAEDKGCIKKEEEKKGTPDGEQCAPPPVSPSDDGLSGAREEKGWAAVVTHGAREPIKKPLDITHTQHTQREKEMYETAWPAWAASQGNRHDEQGHSISDRAECKSAPGPMREQPVSHDLLS